MTPAEAEQATMERLTRALEHDPFQQPTPRSPRHCWTITFRTSFPRTYYNPAMQTDHGIWVCSPRPIPRDYAIAAAPLPAGAAVIDARPYLHQITTHHRYRSFTDSYRGYVKSVLYLGEA